MKVQLFPCRFPPHALATLSTCILLVLVPAAVAAPANDNFADRIRLTGAPTRTAGSNVQATREPGDPVTIGGEVCNATVWYSWVAPRDGRFAAVLVMEIPAVPVIDVYTGSMATGLTQVTAYDGRESYGWRRDGTNLAVFQARFNAVAGTEYSIVSGAKYPYEQPFEIAVTSPPELSSFSPPDRADFAPGSDVPLQVSAMDGDGAISSVEYSIRFGPTLAIGESFPWGAVWTNATTGRYTLIARAIDDLGASMMKVHEVTIGRPPNDDFANRILLVGAPVTTRGDLLAAGKEEGEPSAIGYYTSSRTVWWKWVAPANGRFAVVASATNTVVVGVYTGTSVDGLGLRAFSEVFYSRKSGTGYRYWRQAEWDGTAGTTYCICVDGGSMSPYDVTLSITRPPEVTLTSPLDGSVFSSNSGIIVSAAPSDADGTIAEVEFFEVHRAPTFGWSEPVGTLTSSPWSVSWNGGSAGNYPLAVRAIDDLGAQVVRSNRVWVGVNRPPNDDFAQRITLGNLAAEVTTYGSNTWATAEPGELNAISSVWWSWTAPAIGVAAIDTCGSFDGAYLRVFTGSTLSNLVIFGSASGSPCSSLSFTATAGTTYHIAVEGGWVQGTIQLNIRSAPCPRIELITPVLASSGLFRAYGAGVPGQRSFFEASTNLVDWMVISTNAYTGDPLEFIDPEAGRFAHRFYRLRQAPGS